MKLSPLILCATVALAELPYFGKFGEFAREHYNEQSRPGNLKGQKRAFLYNQAQVNKHNSDESVNFKTGMNEYSDRMPEDFPRGYTYKESKQRTLLTKNREHARIQDPPVSVDWREHGAVAPIRNQGQGETCWSFSSAGAVEGATVARGLLPSLLAVSNQQLIDCMQIDCSDDSGTMTDAFDWLSQKSNGTMFSWDSYPYVDQDCIYWDPPHTCKLKATKVYTQVNGYYHTIVGNETDLMLAVAQQPVAIAVYSSLASFTTYSSGVFNDKDCKQITKEMLDHAVLLVGYGTSNKGEDYWILRNSWGDTWGENGYMRIARNTGSSGGMCGLAIDASYPTLTQNKR